MLFDLEMWFRKDAQCNETDAHFRIMGIFNG